MLSRAIEMDDVKDVSLRKRFIVLLHWTVALLHIGHDDGW